MEESVQRDFVDPEPLDLDSVLSYYRSTAYFRMAFDDPDQRERLAAEVAHRLIARYSPALTVAGAVFVCTGPRHT